MTSNTMERMWRERALEQAITLMGQIRPVDGDLTLADYESMAIGCAERLMQWSETGRDPHRPAR